MGKILVIDDSRLARSMVSDALTDGGFEVVQAHSGQQGLDAFDEYHPDCVITDLLMPEMTGLQFIRHLRAKNDSVPVLVLTSDIQDSSRAKCEALGINKFLHKPVDAIQIVDDVHAAISQQGVKSQ